MVLYERECIICSFIGHKSQQLTPICSFFNLKRLTDQNTGQNEIEEVVDGPPPHVKRVADNHVVLALKLAHVPGSAEGTEIPLLLMTKKVVGTSVFAI